MFIRVIFWVTDVAYAILKMMNLLIVRSLGIHVMLSNIHVNTKSQSYLTLCICTYDFTVCTIRMFWFYKEDQPLWISCT